MMTVQFEQFVKDHPAKPEEQWYRWRAEIRVAVFRCLDKRLLHDIVGIEATTQSRVHTKRDHPGQTSLVWRQQRAPGRGIARRRPSMQHRGFG
jgi:hypothetical protein